MYTYTHTFTHTLSLTRTHIYSLIHIHMLAHLHTHTHRHTDTQTHTISFYCPNSSGLPQRCVWVIFHSFFGLFLKNRQRVAVRGRAVFAHLKWSADAFRRCMSRPSRCGSALPDPCLPHGHLTHRTGLPAPLPLPGPVMVSIREAARHLPRCWSPW